MCVCVCVCVCEVSRDERSQLCEGKASRCAMSLPITISHLCMCVYVCEHVCVCVRLCVCVCDLFPHYY